MRTLREYLRALEPDEPVTSVPGLVHAWLNQDEVRELLHAAWDPALLIMRHDHGVTEIPYDDPDTGKQEILRSRDVTVEVRVAGQVHGMTFAYNPDREPPVDHVLLLEQALRHHLVDVAIGKEPRT